MKELTIRYLVAGDSPEKNAHKKKPRSLIKFILSLYIFLSYITNGFFWGKRGRESKSEGGGRRLVRNFTSRGSFADAAPWVAREQDGEKGEDGWKGER